MKSSGIWIAASAVAVIAGVSYIAPPFSSQSFQLTNSTTALSNVATISGRFVSEVTDFVFGNNAEAATGGGYGGCVYGNSGIFELNYITPGSGQTTDAELEMIFCGSGFNENATVSLARDAFPSLPASTTEYVSEYELKTHFDLTGAASGYWNPTVTHPDVPESSVIEHGFLVWDQIGIWESFPHAAGNQAPVKLVVLGNGFYHIEELELSLNGTRLPGTEINVIYDDKLTVIFDMNGQDTGQWDLLALFADDSSATLENALTVEVPYLKILGIHPARAGNTGQVRAVIEANYIKEGVTAKLRRDGVEIVGLNTEFMRGQLLTTFDIRDAYLGAWDLVLADGYMTGDEDVLTGGFVIEEGRTADPWIDILGSTRVRFTRPTAFRIKIGNRANVDTLVTPVISGLPEDVGWEITLPNTIPPVVMYNSTRDAVRDGKRAIMLPMTRVPAEQVVEFKLTLTVLDDDGDPATNRPIKFNAVIE